jgi:hypothetical protein
MLAFSGLMCIGSYAQTRPVIIKASAFCITIQPGMIPVDDNGNPRPMPIQVERFLYIECSGGEKPQIMEITGNRIPFNFQIMAVAPSIVSAGKRMLDGKELQLTARKNYRFWKIDLTQKAGTSIFPATALKQMTIRYRSGRKTYAFTLNNETEIRGIDRY